VTQSKVAAWRAAVLLLILFWDPGSHARQERPTRDAKALTGSASIRGRVISASDGVGIGEATVTAVETTSGFTRAVTSDFSGAFVLEAVPAGRYVVSASKPTFITGRYGQQTPGETRRALTLGDGKTASIEIKVWKAAVITGKIETPTGEPLPGATANVLRLVVDGEVKRLLRCVRAQYLRIRASTESMASIQVRTTLLRRPLR
jgi:hypothetical protein